MGLFLTRERPITGVSGYGWGLLCFQTIAFKGKDELITGKRVTAQEHLLGNGHLLTAHPPSRPFPVLA